MALATYIAATPGTQPDFRCGFDIELAHALLLPFQRLKKLPRLMLGGHSTQSADNEDQ